MITDMTEKVRRFVSDHGLCDPSTRVLAAVSGGADSVAMLRVLLELGVPVAVGHVNHRLRGEESDRDERFVRHLCDALHVPFFVEEVDVRALAADRGVSVEMAARELRYAALRRMARHAGCARIAVAHHIDDQVETVLLNALRGTGLPGLAGMKPLSGDVIRPLLCVWRDDVLRYLEALRQDYVTDSTNAVNDCKRNRLRNVVLPAITSQFADAPERLADTVGRTAEAVALYDELTRNAVDELLRPHMVEGVRLYRADTAKLLNYRNSVMMLKEIMRRMGFSMDAAGDVMEAIMGKSTGAVFSSYTTTLTVERQFIEFAGDDVVRKLESDGRKSGMELLEEELEVRRCGVPFEPAMVDGRRTIALPATMAAGLTLRHWQDGDRMRPFGMRGTKLLSDLFVDLQFTHSQKRLVWVLEADGEIVWVVGHRAAEATRVDRGCTDWLLLGRRRGE